MNIKDAINEPVHPGIDDCEIYYLNGAIASDPDDAYFRLYRDPFNHQTHLRIPKNEVLGEVYEWTSEELTHSGVTGQKLYRVPLKYGVVVQGVEITIEKLGDTIDGDTSAYSPEAVALGKCRTSSGCGKKKCCTEGSKGCSCNNCCLA